MLCLVAHGRPVDHQRGAPQFVRRRGERRARGVGDRGFQRRHGAPPYTPEEPVALQWVAKLTHLGLYALMILMPVSGALAWFGGAASAAQAHELMRILLLALIGLHILGALYHQFILRTDIMSRMRLAR